MAFDPSGSFSVRSTAVQRTFSGSGARICNYLRIWRRILWELSEFRKVRREGVREAAGPLIRRRPGAGLYIHSASQARPMPQGLGIS